MLNSSLLDPITTSTQSQSLLVTIEGIATGTPDNVTTQSDAAQFVASVTVSERNRNRIEKIYKNTRIDQRYLAADLLSQENYEFSRQPGNIAQRMAMFEAIALPLAEKVARQALAAAQSSQSNIRSRIEDEIGLIVFVTSTGFVAPGIDAKLIKNLGLKRNIARIPVHFMGCAAAMNGLRVASDYVKANTKQKALVICLELSSINAVFEDNLNDIIIHSIFSDGCAAVVLGAHDAETIQGQRKLAICDHFSYLVEDTEDGITLGINDQGITCKLSRDLPNYIEAGLAPIIHNALANHHWHKEDIDLWAIHPGGTRIIEKAQAALALDDAQVMDSWEILRQYGNMLSCSILFVLERMMQRLEATSFAASPHNPLAAHKSPLQTLNGIGFSFAPGIGVEGILFEVL